MMKILLLTLLFISNAHSYTLNNNFSAAFKSNKVSVYVDPTTQCPNSKVTVYELVELIKPAMNKFWNTVPTSNLELKSGGFSNPVTNINDGRLCAPTNEKCITDAAATVIAPVSGIVIACNTNALNFGDDNVIAVTIPNSFSGKEITGAVILINEASTIFSTLSKSDRIGVLAHEIGHAIGLGHTKDSAALMYYRVVDQRSALGEDDMRGVSDLYPMQFDGGGLLGGCGTIQTGGGVKSPPFWQMGAMLALMIAVIEAIKLFNRTKARSAT